MAWAKGIVIRGGMYESSTIGISELFPPNVDFYYIQANNNVNESHSETIYNTTTPDFFVSDFDNYINVSSIFAKSSPDFADECIADIAIMNGKTLKGYYSLYATKDGGDPKYITIMGKIKNASGVVLGDFHGSGSIAIQMGSYGDNPIVYLSLAKTTYNDHTIYGLFFNFCQVWRYGSGIVFKQYAGAFIDDDTISSYWGIDGNIDKDVKNKSPEFGEASEPGGGYIPTNPHGTFDFSSVDIPISPKPSLGVTSAGFINVYKIEINELKDLGEKLFPHFLPAELLDNPANLTTPEMLATFLKILYGSIISPVGTSIAVSDNLGIIDILMNGKLIDYILDCHIIPTSISGATVSPLKIGYRTFNDFQLAKATEDYVDVDCGTLNIKECFANFLDYTCKVEIFLPGVGYVPLANEYWNNATLQVHYRFNIIDGSFQVRLVSSRDNDGKECVLKNSVIAQYGGVCCVHFPITGLQYSNVVSGLVNGTASTIAKGSSGDYAGAATNLANMAMLTPDAPASNGYNASSSFLGQRIPYLVIKRPAPQFSKNYPKEIGLPLNVTLPLTSVHGFTIIDNPVLNVACSDEEYNEIISLLKSGVIF